MHDVEEEDDSPFSLSKAEEISNRQPFADEEDEEEVGSLHRLFFFLEKRRQKWCSLSNQMHLSHLETTKNERKSRRYATTGHRSSF